MHGQRGWTLEGVLPTAVLLLLLLEVLRTALQEPGQLLEDSGALHYQGLASANPTLERGLWGQGTAWILIGLLNMGLKSLDTAPELPAQRRSKTEKCWDFCLKIRLD